MALFAAFFSAILLALTSYARSFKEAQAYIIPLMLLCLVPGVLCLMPGLEFKGWMAVTPLVNIVMLARDLLEGSVDHEPGDCRGVLHDFLHRGGDRAGGADLRHRRDSLRQPGDVVGPRAAAGPNRNRPPASGRGMFCLALMFPCYFVLANSLGRSPELSMDRRLAVGALITAAVFGGIPIAIAMFGRVRWSSGLGIAQRRRRGVRGGRHFGTGAVAGCSRNLFAQRVAGAIVR